MNNIAYRIETERLVIRCYEPSDAPLLLESVHESLAHLLPWMPWAAHEEGQTVADKVQLIRHFRALFDKDEDYIYAIFNREESKLLGGSGLHLRHEKGAAEIGYWVNVHAMNQGIITESTHALTKVGFEVFDFRRIEIRHTVQNVRSQRIPEKLGYIKIATLPKRIQNAKGTYSDAHIWNLFKEEYKQLGLSEGVSVKTYNAMGDLIKVF